MEHWYLEKNSRLIGSFVPNNIYAYNKNRIKFLLNLNHFLSDYHFDANLFKRNDRLENKKSVLMFYLSGIIHLLFFKLQQ